MSLLLSGRQQKKGLGWRLAGSRLLVGTDPHSILTSQLQVYCGRYISAHMLHHHEDSGHPLVLSYVDLSTWCYNCEAYVHHQVGPGQSL